MGVAELAHFAFPFLTGRQVAYFPVLAGAAILASLGGSGSTNFCNGSRCRPVAPSKALICECKCRLDGVDFHECARYCARTYPRWQPRGACACQIGVLDFKESRLTSIGFNRLSRRRALEALAAPAMLWCASPLTAVSQAPGIYSLDVKRDAGCGCCHAWADVMKATGRFQVAMAEEADMVRYKKRLGVPPALASCHTATVEGYVIEGHVPAMDILRLIAERPAGIVGIAVPGMPRGSPGMEMPNGARDAFSVLAFDANGVSNVFAKYASNR